MFAALRYGFRDALRLSVLLPLYGWGLLLGLVQAWPLLLAARDGALTNPFLGQLASGGGNALINLFLGNQAATATTARTWGISFVGLLLLYSLGYNFLSGGMLNEWAGKSSFWRGGTWAFWPFTGLGALLVILALVAAGLAAAVGVGVGPQVGVIIALVLLQLLNMLGEYARAIAVVEYQRNPFYLFGRATAFCARRPGTLLLALAGLLLHAGLAYLSLLALQAISGVLAVLVQQVLVFAWLWIKGLRLAWALNYIEAVDVRQSTRSLDAVLGPAR